LIALAIFVFSYVAFSVGRVPGLRSDRLAAAIIGAALVVAVGGLPMREAQAAIDGSTLALLFGMMVVSAALELSGTFGLVVFWASRVARSPFGLVCFVATSSGLLSAFLINDVVVLAMTPVVLRLCDDLGTDPKPALVALATSSNIGSVATITGNPQNVLVGSLSGLSYGRFAAALAPVAILALAVNLLVLRLAYAEALRAPLAFRPSKKRPRVYRRWVWKGAAVTLGVVAAFFAGVPPAVAALVGAALVLFTRAVKPRRVYARVDWTLLALFAGLFVIVAGVERQGLGERLIGWLGWLRPETTTGLTALTAVVSNVVSNVPAVMVLKSMVSHLPDPERAWLTLSMASTLAGNITIPGSIATLIVLERAERAGVKVSLWEFTKVGLPSAALSLVIGAAWLALTR